MGKWRVEGRYTTSKKRFRLISYGMNPSEASNLACQKIWKKLGPGSRYIVGIVILKVTPIQAIGNSARSRCRIVKAA